MTASAPAIWAVSCSTLDRSLTTSETSPRLRNTARAGSRTNATTSSPRAARRSTMARPIKPAPPVITTRIAARLIRSRLPDRRARVDRLQPALDVSHELAGLCTICCSVIEPERHVHHWLDTDQVATRRLHYDGPLHDRLHRQDADLRCVDDRLRDDRSRPARVIERERATLYVIERELVAARPISKVAQRPVQAVDREPVCVLDDGHDEPVLDRDRDAQVDLLATHVAFVVVRGVEVGVALERLDCRLGHERIVRQADAFLRLVLTLVALAQGDDAAHVHFDDGVRDRDL